MDKNDIKILVVDDQPNNLRFLSDLLNREGYKVQRAISGKLALNAVMANFPDLILLDIMMPEMNGYEVCQKLKAIEKTREIPIIFLSALDEASDKVKAFTLGGADYITKPFQVEEVLARIENQLTIGRLQKKLQAQNSYLQKEIEARKQAERTKDELISIVSHELKTPLTSMRASLGVLMAGNFGTLQPQGQRMLEIALNSTDRLVRLVNDILDLERIESGIDIKSMQHCNIAELIIQAVEIVQPMADKAKVIICISAIPVQRRVNPDRIVQVLTNLLSNAIKFSPSGSTVWLTAELEGLQDLGEIEKKREMKESTKFLVSNSKSSHHNLANLSPQTSELVIKVKDRGRGIPPNKLEAIFDRFQQVDVSDSRQKGGSGLGLTICRNIVKQHGGRIWVESNLNAGSTFYFTLPDLLENCKQADRE